MLSSPSISVPMLSGMRIAEISARSAIAAAAREPSPASSNRTSTCSGVSTPCCWRRSGGAGMPGTRVGGATSSSYAYLSGGASGDGRSQTDGCRGSPRRRPHYLSPSLHDLSGTRHHLVVAARCPVDLRSAVGSAAAHRPRPLLGPPPILCRPVAHGRRHPRDLRLLPRSRVERGRGPGAGPPEGVAA